MAAMVSASNLLIVTPSPMLQLSCGPKRVSVRWSTQSKNFDAPISAVAADDLARARFTSSATARTLPGGRSGRICRRAVVPVPRVPHQQTDDDQNGDDDSGDGARVHSIASSDAYRAVRIEITHYNLLRLFAAEKRASAANVPAVPARGGPGNSAGIRRSQCRGAATAARSSDPAFGVLVLAWKHDVKVLSSGFDDPDGATKLERHQRDALASGSHGTQKVVVLLRPETGIALRHGDVIKACKEERRPVLGLRGRTGPVRRGELERSRL